MPIQLKLDGVGAQAANQEARSLIEQRIQSLVGTLSCVTHVFKHQKGPKSNAKKMAAVVTKASGGSSEVSPSLQDGHADEAASALQNVPNEKSAAPPSVPSAPASSMMESADVKDPTEPAKVSGNLDDDGLSANKTSSPKSNAEVVAPKKDGAATMSDVPAPLCVVGESAVIDRLWLHPRSLVRDLVHMVELEEAACDKTLRNASMAAASAATKAQKAERALQKTHNASGAQGTHVTGQGAAAVTSTSSSKGKKKSKGGPSSSSSTASSNSLAKAV